LSHRGVSWLWGSREPRAAAFAVWAAGIFIFGLPTKVRCGRAKGR
jgi:hypothetical protein